MSRLYFFEQDNGETVSLSSEDERQLCRVLRTKIGTQITVSDGNGKAYICRVDSLNPLTLQKVSSLEKREVRRDVAVFLSLSKGDKLSLSVQKCTELGAKTIVLLPTNNSDVKAENVKFKLERFERIALEAAKQCGRYNLPHVFYLDNLNDALAYCDEKGFEILICHETASERLTSLELTENVALFIGPEGGFDPSEVEKVTAGSGRCVLISDNVLRCETAAILAVGIAMEL